MQNLYFSITFLLFTLILTGCGNGGGEDSNVATLTMESFEFAELKGREGHQGIFPLDSEPVPGEVYAVITTKGDLKSVVVDIKDESGNEKKYTPDTLSRTTDDLKSWYIKLDIPNGKSLLKVVASLSDSTNKTIYTREIIGKSFKILLHGKDLSPGGNIMHATIINYGSTAGFLISAKDNYNYVNGQFIERTVNIEKDESVTIDIPIYLERSSFTEDIYDYSFNLSVENSTTKELNTAASEFDIKKTPFVIPEEYKLVAVNPTDCNPIQSSSPTVEIVIAGSEKLYLDDVDLNSIFWMDTEIKPLSSYLADNISFNSYKCEATIKDGLTDLIMSFSLAEIIGSGSKGSTDFSASIDFMNSDNISGHTIDFNMVIGD